MKVVMVSIILGSAQLGLSYGVTNRSGHLADDVAQTIIRRALRSGIDCIDTARAYGAAESRIGAVLSAHEDRHSVSVVTKLDPFTGVDFTVLQSSVIEHLVNSSVYQSLHHLRAREIDTLCLHRFEHYRNPVVWTSLLKLKERGLIGALGVSVDSVEDTIAALRDSNIGHVQIPLSVVDWRWRNPEFRKLCGARKDVVVHCRSVLLQGLLVNDAEMWPDFKNVRPSKIMERIDSIVTKHGMKSRVELCLSYASSMDFVHGIVVGVDNVEQLATNMEMRHRTLEKHVLDEIEQTFTSENVPAPLLNPSRWKELTEGES